MNKRTKGRSRPSIKKEKDMKEDIVDTMARGLVLGVLILFGLRGVLPAEGMPRTVTP